MLPMAFWPSILHGASSCPISDIYLKKLRTSAVRALGVAHGGASPLIRLSISKQPAADPGYYQLIHTVHDFRRISRKSPQLQEQWNAAASTGSGSYSKQLDGRFWCPPLFSDHDGLIHNLFTLDSVALDSLLEEAWMQHVAEQVRHRSTLSDLAGIDKFQTLQFDDKLTPLKLAQINCIREGSFISPWQQSRFDLTKHADCAVCNVPNTQLHWVECPKFAEHRLDQPEILTWLPTKPCSFMQHLLVPRSPHLKKYRQTLLQTPCSFKFYSKPTCGMQHIFTDGSCTRHAGGTAPLAAWAVVSASSSDVISGGHLAGFTQSSNRAELQALIAAVSWIATYQCNAQIWCDSKSTVQVATALQQGDHSCSVARRTTMMFWQLLRNKSSTQSHSSSQYIGYLRIWILYSAQMSLRNGFALGTTLQTALLFLSMRAGSPHLSASCKCRRSGATVGRMQLGLCSRFTLLLPIQSSTQANRSCPNCKVGTNHSLIGPHMLGILASLSSSHLLGFRPSALALVSALLNLRRNWLHNWRSGMTLHANLSPSV